MRKVGWSCLSMEISCAETRNSSSTAQLQAPGAAKTGADVSPLGLASQSLLGSRSAVVRGLWHRHITLLRAAAGPVLAVLRGVGRMQVEEAGAKALLQLCQGLRFPGREILPFYQGGSRCSAWHALETPGFAVLQLIPGKSLPCSVP